MNKQALRKEFISLRSFADFGEGEQCAVRLAELPAFQAARTVFCYASYGSELPTDAILALCRREGKRIALPRVLDRTTMRFYSAEGVAPGYRGIPEPSLGEEILPQKGDLMLLPGLAFSRKGERLGYGGGYYDRYLASAEEQPILCGVGFCCQLVDSLPTEAHDVRLDLVLTSKEILCF